MKYSWTDGGRSAASLEAQLRILSANDCAVVAFTHALNISYDQAVKLLRAGRFGVNENVIRRVLRKRGWRYKRVHSARQLPRTGVIISDWQGKEFGHLSCLINGVAMDQDDPVENSRYFDMPCIGYWYRP